MSKKVKVTKPDSVHSNDNLRNEFGRILKAVSQGVPGSFWHLNPKPGDPEGLHQLLGITYTDLITLFDGCGYRGDDGKVARASAFDLASRICCQQSGQAIPFKLQSEHRFYLRLGVMPTDLTKPGQQYFKGVLSEFPFPSSRNGTCHLDDEERAKLNALIKQCSERLFNKEATRKCEGGIR
jgi:hypothetical protein